MLTPKGTNKPWDIQIIEQGLTHTVPDGNDYNQQTVQHTLYMQPMVWYKNMHWLSTPIYIVCTVTNTIQWDEMLSLQTQLWEQCDACVAKYTLTRNLSTHKVRQAITNLWIIAFGLAPKCTDVYAHLHMHIPVHSSLAAHNITEVLWWKLSESTRTR